MPRTNASYAFYEEGKPLAAILHQVSAISRTHVMKRVRQEKWYRPDFRPPCIGTLHGVAVMGPVSQKDLGNWLGLDPSDIVSIIDGLEDAGLVQRNRDTADRRRQLISLTPQGAVARKRLVKIGSEALEETLAPLNERERETLKKLLARVVEYHYESE